MVTLATVQDVPTTSQTDSCHKNPPRTNLAEVPQLPVQPETPGGDCHRSLETNLWRTRAWMPLSCWPRRRGPSVGMGLPARKVAVPRQEAEEGTMRSWTSIDLPADLIAKAVDIVSKRLDFKHPLAPKPSERASKLRTTTEASQSSSSCVPVDVVCFDRTESLQARRKWSAFQAKQDRSLKVHDETRKQIFNGGEGQGISTGTFKDLLRRS